mmetsp:Transcript_55791/g.172947  ORF Transcript_55791/g.172947 Transcript_55791/m.172947 type:complete len:370 (+) Transcript_55791:80-1189(+)
MSIFSAYAAGKTVGASSTGGSSFGGGSVFISYPPVMGASSTGGYASPAGSPKGAFNDSRGGGIFGSTDTPKNKKGVPPIVDNRRTSLEMQLAEGGHGAPTIVLKGPSTQMRMEAPPESLFASHSREPSPNSTPKSIAGSPKGFSRQVSGAGFGRQMSGSKGASSPLSGTANFGRHGQASASPSRRASQVSEQPVGHRSTGHFGMVDETPMFGAQAGDPHVGHQMTGPFGMDGPPAPPPADYASKAAPGGGGHQPAQKAAPPPPVELTGDQNEDMKRLLQQLNSLQATSPTTGVKRSMSMHDSDEVPGSAFDDLRDTTMKLVALMPQKDHVEKLPADGDLNSTQDFRQVNRAAEEALKGRMRDLASAKGR